MKPADRILEKMGIPIEQMFSFCYMNKYHEFSKQIYDIYYLQIAFKIREKILREIYNETSKNNY